MNNKDYIKFIEELKTNSKNNWIPIVRDNTLKLILTILSIKKPKTILEIGTAVGYSAICFAKHLENINELKITTIEIDKEMASIAKKNIAKVGLNYKIQVINEDAKIHMQDLINSNCSFDVIFIDAAKSQYQEYLNLSKKLSHDGTVILIDNILLSGMVKSDYNEHKHRTQVNKLREFLENLKIDKELLSTIVEIEDGLAICVYKGN